MADLQSLFDAISRATSNERSNYHLTLGKFIERIEAYPPETLVQTELGEITGFSCYRGYYQDCAINAGPRYGVTGKTLKTVGEVLEAARAALGSTMEGYKGGDYVMKEDTPLWLASYNGDYSSIAVFGIAPLTSAAGDLHLQTKRLEW